MPSHSWFWVFPWRSQNVLGLNCGHRNAHNVDPELYNADQFNLVHSGLFSYLEHYLGKEAADEGAAMIVISGTSAADPDRRFRTAVFLSGTCYAPKVFDVLF